MKRISIELLRKRATVTLMRFPLVIASGAALAVTVIADVDDERYVLAFILGISTLLGCALFAERAGGGLPIRAIASMLGAAAVVCWFLSADGPRSGYADSMRFGLYLVAAHLLVAFAPFTGRGRVNGFWQFNRVIFVRVLTGVLYSGVLYAGLALAIAAMDRLFDTSFGPEAYNDLAVLLFGVFNTWFFLAGVPEQPETLDAVVDYPKALKAFTQFVLLPLVMLYAVILYAYAGKILIEWQWPHGWVSGLVLGYAVAGILSFLLLYPIREGEGNRWIKAFGSWFFAALLPLVVLLFLALKVRIDAYGITEQRYFALVLAGWLGAVGIYFTVRRGGSIKVIPASLALLAVLSSFGPWGALDVTVNDQFARLKELLRGSGMLKDGHVVKASDTLGNATKDRIRSIVYLLDRRQELRLLGPLLAEHKTPRDPEEAFASLGISSDPGSYRTAGAATRPDFRGHISRVDMDVLNVSGFDAVIYFNRYPESTKWHTVFGRSYGLTYSDSTGLLTIHHASGPDRVFALRDAVVRLCDTLSAAGEFRSWADTNAVQDEDELATMPVSKLMIRAVAGDPDVVCVLSTVTIERNGRDVHLDALAAEVLLRK